MNKQTEQNRIIAFNVVHVMPTNLSIIERNVFQALNEKDREWGDKIKRLKRKHYRQHNSNSM